jgi:hypothetical protein
LNNASALWIDASLEDRLRLQEVLFPQGLVWDGAGFQTPVTCLSFYNLAPIERSGAAPRPIDGVQTPPISLASNELVSSAWRKSELGIDTIDPTYYTVAHGDGQATASGEAGIDVGGHAGFAA